MSLLADVTLEDETGTQVALMMPGYRMIAQAENLAGLTVRAKTLPAVGRHGQVVRTRYRDAQLPVLTGFALDEFAGDHDRAWQEYYAMARAFAAAVDTDRLLRWTAGGVELQQLVRVEDVRAPVEAGPALIRWQVTFRAGDPRAYSQTVNEAFVEVLGT